MTNRTIFNLVKHPTALPIFVASGILLTSLIGIVALTRFFWEMPFGTDTLQIVLTLTLGVFIAIPTLLAVWSSLGAMSWLPRFSLGTGIQIVLLSAYLGTIYSLSSSFPLLVYLLFVVIVLAINLAIQIPLSIFRSKTRLCLAIQSPGDVTPRQFGIKHLFVVTTVAAIVVAVTQAVLPKDLTFYAGGPPIWVMAAFCSCFLILIALLTYLSIATVFIQRNRSPFLGMFLFCLVASPLAIVIPIWRLTFWRNPAKISADTIPSIAVNTYCFSISFAASVCLVLGTFYLLGIRLRSSAS